MQNAAPAVVDPQAEVRRCHSCGQAALVCFNAWRHSYNGLKTDYVTRDCRCQACGTVVILHTKISIAVLWVMGAIFLLAVFPGIFMLLMARRRSRAWKLNPVVPGAPSPPIRYRLGPGPRRCGQCGGECEIVSITRRRTNGIPTGTECKYSCRGCSQSFSTQDALGVVLNAVAGLLCVGIAYWILVAVTSSPGWRYGGGGFAGLCGAALLAQTVAYVTAASKNPAL